VPGRQDDDPAWRADPRSDGSVTRSVPLAAAAAVAVVASLLVFVTTDLRMLRLGAVAAAWAVVAATFVAVRRGAQLGAVNGREHALRRAHDRELELEAAARRELELQIENEVRRETEDGLRGEVAALRADLATLARLREDLGRAGDPAGLSSLRADLRADLAADLGQLPELRADLARLRAELTEQLSSELLVERIVMRTQGVRFAGEERVAAAAGAPEVAATWQPDPPPRELTGGWPAVRLDEPQPTRAYEPVRAERPVRPQAEPPRYDAGRLEVPRSEGRHEAPGREAGGYAAPRHDAPRHDAPRHDGPRHGALRPDDALPGARQHADPPRPVPFRRRRTDEDGADDAPDPGLALTEERPTARRERPPLPSVRPIVAAEPAYPATSLDVYGAAPSAAPPAHSASAHPAPADPGPASSAPAPADAEPAGHARLAEILAENGTTPPPGGRRRRRYRDGDEPDDVLSRVLGE
jgi:hypothetical protein